MSAALIGYVGLACVLGLILLRVPIAAAMGLVASCGLFAIYAFPPYLGFMPDAALISLTSLLTTLPFGFLNSYMLSAVPLFILLGLLAHHARFTTDLYEAARYFLAPVRGGVAMASVIGCGGFSAISGSSIACAATMGKIAVPQMLAQGYSKSLATSSVAVGGTLGSLIPPSILLIIYGLFTEQSVAQLFIAALVPGILSLLLYLIVISIWVRARPDAAPTFEQTADAKAEGWRALGRSWPVLMIFVIVLGGIYLGIFTATEAAAIGAAITLLIGLALRRLRPANLVEAVKESAIQTSYLFAIGVGGKLFVAFIALSGIASDLVLMIEESQLSIVMLLAVIVLVYIVLGMVLDPLGIILLSLPLTVPIMEAHGFSLVWFGVIVVKLLEIGLITPPVGLNVFVIKSVVGDEIPMGRIFAGVVPFLVAEIPLVALLVAFPQISLWLVGLLH